MDLPLLLIWLAVCLPQYVQSSSIDRQQHGDIIYAPRITTASSRVTKQTCSKYGALCVNKTKCKACRCGKNVTTFYKNKANVQVCVSDPNAVDECKYYIGERSTAAHSIQLKNGTTNTKVGIIKHNAVKLLGATCTASSTSFWNLLEWTPLEKNVLLKITQQKFEQVVTLHTPKKNGEVYKGLLIKLDIQCISSSNTQSCVIFKLLGKRKYGTNPGDKTKPKKTTIEPKLKSKSKFNWIIVIASVAGVVVLILIAIVICCCWKRRRKTKYENGDANKSRKELLKRDNDPDYQKPEKFTGRKSEEINNSADNLTYLQPVDGKRYQDESNKHAKGKRHGNKKMDPNYDLPNVNISMSACQKGEISTGEDDVPAIYAECGDPTTATMNHQYTDPNKIKPRPITPAVVGMPGYQPPSGPASEAGSSSTKKDKYSTLELSSTEDGSVYQPLVDIHGKKLDEQPENGPPSPQYAELIPDDEVDEDSKDTSI